MPKIVYLIVLLNIIILVGFSFSKPLEDSKYNEFSSELESYYIKTDPSELEPKSLNGLLQLAQKDDSDESSENKWKSHPELHLRKRSEKFYKKPFNPQTSFFFLI